MELYEAVSLIRKKKNIKIDDVIANNISRSTFNRYVTGKSDLYSKNLIKLLDNLKVSLDELELIANNYADNDQNILLANIKEAFDKREINQLIYWKKFCEDKYNTERNILYSHSIGLIEVLIARIKQEPIDLHDNVLYQYLVKTETWTRYELIMFNNSMFYFDTDLVKHILPKVIERLSYYNNFNRYTHEVCRLLSNVIIYFMQYNDFQSAFHYIHIMEKTDLGEEHVFERLLFKFFEGIKLLMIDSHQAQAHINQCLQIMEFLELRNLKYMSEAVVTELLKMK